MILHRRCNGVNMKGLWRKSIDATFWVRRNLNIAYMKGRLIGSTVMPPDVYTTRRLMTWGYRIPPAFSNRRINGSIQINGNDRHRGSACR